MVKLSIKNFGPISSGYKSDEGFFDIKQCSVFIGPQGSGKSCVVKLISLFSWLEKNLVADSLDDKISSPEFIKKIFAYHGIAEYLNKKTELKYKGTAYDFTVTGETLKTIPHKNGYVRPKVLYIPADRSFCTAIKNPGKIKGLPENTFEFLLDFADAELGLKEKIFSIPINGFCFSYDEKKRQAFLLDEKKNFKIDISYASSGILSALPLTLTTAYYSGFLSVRPMTVSLDQTMKKRDEAITQLSKIQSVLDNLEKLDKTSSDAKLKHQRVILQSLGKELSNLEKAVGTPSSILSKDINSRLINIVEEPEQNLFPEAQADVLYYLIQCMNSGSVLGGRNSLVISTHSPYVIEALNNSIYAKRLVDEGKSVTGLFESNELVSYDDVSAYKLANGVIESIKDDESKQIDSGYLDSCSERIRSMYSKLEDIEFSNE